MKKKWLICTALLALAALLFGIMAAKNLSFRVGTCIKTENGGCMLLMEDSPVALSNRTPLKNAFADFNTGDTLLVLHDGILETYPGRTGAYWVLRLHKGDGTGVPREVLNALSELGWIVE